MFVEMKQEFKSAINERDNKIVILEGEFKVLKDKVKKKSKAMLTIHRLRMHPS